MRPYVVWPWVGGLPVLVGGVLLARRRVASARGLDKLIALAPVLIASPLAAFAAEHLTITSSIEQIIPAFYPARLLLVYVVAAGLYAAALSFIVRRLDWLAAALLSLMFVIFVVTMHVPNAMASGERIGWIVALRDLSFGGGAMALAGAWGAGRLGGAKQIGTLGRLIVAIACVVFGVLHFFQPTHTPGVPLQKVMPPWLPAAPLWGYVTGVIEIIAGTCMLANRRRREAAGWLGLVIVVLVVVVYLPFVATAVEGGEKLEALNYVFDTLLFAGTVLAVGT